MFMKFQWKHIHKAVTITIGIHKINNNDEIYPKEKVIYKSHRKHTYFNYLMNNEK